MGDSRFNTRDFAAIVANDASVSDSTALSTQIEHELEELTAEERLYELRVVATQLERDGLLPSLLMEDVVAGENDIDANNNGIKDSIDGGDDFKLDDIRRFAESADTLRDQVIAQALLDRFSVIEAADNHLYDIAPGIQDAKAGRTAFEQYIQDHTTLQSNPDGSVVLRNRSGRVSEVLYSDGSISHFTYDDRGNIIQFTADNQVYKFENGVLQQYESDGLTPIGIEHPGERCFVDSSGNLNLLHSDGTFSLYRTDGSIATYDSNWTIIASDETDSQSPSAGLDKHGLDEAATFIHDALRPGFLANIDSDAIFDRLEAMNEADRRRLETYYFQKYNTTLVNDFKDILWADDYNRAITILERHDNEADDVGQLFVLIDQLNRSSAPGMSSDNLDLTGDQLTPEAQIVVNTWKNISREQSASEKELRDMFSLLNSEDLAALAEGYEARFGASLTEAVLQNPSISPTTKAAIEIYLRGTDQRTDADLVQLANIALNAGDPLMFQEALRGSSETARHLLMNGHNVPERINIQFPENDRNLAIDYLETGGARLSTLVRGDTHWLHTNKDAILQACNNVSDAEKELFRLGRSIAIEGNEVSSLSESEREALQFYNDVHSAFSTAAYEWEVLGWESLLLYDNTLIRDVSSKHHDGALGSAVGSYNDDLQILERIQNMSEAEWKLLSGYTESTEPAAIAEAQEEARQFRAYLERTLDAMWITGDDRRRLTETLNWMQATPSYGEAGRTSSIEQLFRDFQGGGAFGTYGRDTSRIINGLLNISLADANRYRNEPEYFNLINGYVNSSLEDGPMKTLAQHYLNRLKNAPEMTEEALRLDQVECFLNQALNKAPAATLIETIESNPILLQLIRTDPGYRHIFEQALRHSLEDGKADRNLFLQYQTVDDIVNEIGRCITDQGRLSIGFKMQICENSTERFSLLQTVTEDERLMLLERPPSSSASQALQEKVFGCLSEEERQLFTQMLTCGLVERDGLSILNLGPEELVRAYVLGCGDIDTVRAILSSEEMTNEAKIALFNAYSSDYGTDLVNDVLKTVGQDGEFEFERLLAVTSINARQQFYDLNHSLQTSWGLLDEFMQDSWDFTKQQAFEQSNDYAAALATYSKAFEEMPADMQQELAESLNSALELYRKSKGEMADSVIEVLITVSTLLATVAATALTGGIGLGLIISAAAASGAFKVGAKAVLEGSDFEVSAQNLFANFATGAISGGLNMIGPEIGGAIVGLGRQAATNAAERVFGSLLSHFGDDIIGAAGRETLENGLRSLVTRTLSNGLTEVPERGLTRLAESIATEALGEGVDDATRQALITVLTREMKTVLAEEVRVAAGSWIRRTVTEAGMNAFAGALGGGGSGAFFGALNYDSSLSIGDNLRNIGAGALMGAGAGIIGGTLFTAGFKAVGVAVEIAGKPAIRALREVRGWLGGRPITVPEGGIIPDGATLHPDDMPAYLGDVPPDAPPMRTVFDESLDVDGRPPGFRDRISNEFAPLTKSEQAAALRVLRDDLRKVRAGLDSDGNVISLWDQIANHPTLSNEQKTRILNVMAEVREHYASLIAAKVKDQDVSWLHTADEIARLLELARRHDSGIPLTPIELENRLLASMFADSAKYPFPNSNLLTHHLDGALAAAEVLARYGLPAERVDMIVKGILVHQMEPPQFWGKMYFDSITKALNDRLASNEITRAQFDELTFRLSQMSERGRDQIWRIKFVADGKNANVIRSDNGLWEVAFTEPQLELMRTVGIDHWYVAHDPRLSGDFASFPLDVQERLMQEFRLQQDLLDVDAVNYGTIGGDAKMVAITGPDSPFPVPDIWGSFASADRSYMDTLSLLSQEGQILAGQNLQLRNEMKERLRQDLLEWFEALGDQVPRDDSLKIPYFDAPLNYHPSNPLEQQQFEFAKQIREYAVEWLRRNNTVDGDLPGPFLPVRGQVSDNIDPDAFLSDLPENIFTDESPSIDEPTIHLGDTPEDLADFGLNGFFGGKKKPSKIPASTIPVEEVFKPGSVDTNTPVVVNRTVLPDGTVDVDYGGLLHVVQTPDGRPIRISRANRSTTNFHYDNSGQLAAIERGNTIYRRIDDTTWEVSGFGKSSELFDGHITVDEDGTIYLASSTQKDRVEVLGIDGSRQVAYIDENNNLLRISYERANFKVERHRIVDFMRMHLEGEPARFKRFFDLMERFEKQTANLGDDERALFYHQLNRLLGPDQSTTGLTFAGRLRLAEQLLLDAGHPFSIDQGRRKTCILAAFQKRMLASNPSEVARIIADIALTGKYTTTGFNGKMVTVDLATVPGALYPDIESKLNLIPFNPDVAVADLRVNLRRNWEQQIFQTAMANIKWIMAETVPEQGPLSPARRLSPGEYLMYELMEGPRPQERLYLYSPGQAPTPVFTTNVPGVSMNDLLVLYREIMNDDSDFIVRGFPKETDLQPEGPKLIPIDAPQTINDKPLQVPHRVSTLEELMQVLQNSTAKNNFPMVVGIHTQRMDWGRYFSKGPGGGAGHAMLILGFDPATNIVTISNSWGRGSHAMQVPIETLLAALS